MENAHPTSSVLVKLVTLATIAPLHPVRSDALDMVYAATASASATKGSMGLHVNFLIARIVAVGVESASTVNVNAIVNSPPMTVHASGLTSARSHLLA